MNPVFQSLPALTLVGLEAHFIGPLSPGSNNHQVIPPLFGRFCVRQEELAPPLDEFTYGATRLAPPEDRACEDELVYLAGHRVPPWAPVPVGMVRWRMPARTYALFVHRGPVARLDETMAEIYGAWLPQSGYELADTGSLERYESGRFGDGGAQSEFEILIAVRPRSAGPRC